MKTQLKPQIWTCQTKTSMVFFTFKVWKLIGFRNTLRRPFHKIAKLYCLNNYIFFLNIAHGQRLKACFTPKSPFCWSSRLLFSKYWLNFIQTVWKNSSQPGPSGSSDWWMMSKTTSCFIMKSIFIHTHIYISVSREGQNTQDTVFLFQLAFFFFMEKI